MQPQMADAEAEAEAEAEADTEPEAAAEAEAEAEAAAPRCQDSCRLSWLGLAVGVPLGRSAGGAEAQGKHQAEQACYPVGRQVSSEVMRLSNGFKARMVQRMSGPEGLTATALAAETGLGQTTLSRWKRQAATILAMSEGDKRAPSKQPPDGRPAEEKFRLVMQAASLSDKELGEFLRREGVHESHLSAWRKEMLEALSGTNKPSVRARSGTQDAKRVKALQRELRRKDKALAETAALLVLQKKVQALWEEEDDDTEDSGGK